MSGKRVAGATGIRDQWGPAFREVGYEYEGLNTTDDALRSSADCILIDARQPNWIRDLPKLKAQSHATILSVVKESIGREDLVKLRSNGSAGYLTEGTPAEEVVVRVRAMLSEANREGAIIDSRAAARVWFQQKVEFKVFDRSYTAWSTTLSETGIFLRTSLSFPIYSTIHMSFNLLGESALFECDGVIVRQEVEGDIRGLGVMFQNLTGEKLRMLESFMDLYRS